MALWNGKSRGNKLGYSIFVGVLTKFGVLPAYVLLKLVVLYFFIFSYKTSRELFRFYHHRLKYSFLTCIGKLYSNYYQLGQSIIDKVVVMGGIKNSFTFNFDGEDHLRSITKLQRGGMLLSAHIGNWDIAGFLLKRLDTPINIVIFDGEYQKIKDYLQKVTGKREINVIVIGNDLSHIYEINNALKNNELVCMHADRFIEGNKTLIANFCGNKARFPMGPFLLATRFKVPVTYVFAVKESSLHYHFFASEAKTYDHPDKGINMQQMLNDFSMEMEAKVRQYPNQWFNYYNFWKL